MTIGITFGLRNFFTQAIDPPLPDAFDELVMEIEMKLMDLGIEIDPVGFEPDVPAGVLYGPHGPGRARADAYPASMMLVSFDLAQRPGCHVPPSDRCGGVMVFLPHDLRDVLIPGGSIPLLDDEPLWVGSAPRLMDDLKSCAPRLGIHLDHGVLSDNAAEEIEDEDVDDGRKTWLLLYEAARLSLEHRVALVLS